VPLLFTAQDWDPRRQPVSAWLTGRLQETYPLFVGKAGAADAAGLIAGGKISVILDGLDEIAADLRPVAVQALSEQASFRVVVLSRTAEMASTASQRGGLQGAAAIELRPIDAAAAADYLERVQLDPLPDGWRDLIGRIRASPRSPLAHALDSPLTLTLVHDTYQSEDDAHELLDFCDATQQRVSGNQVAEQIKDHLLDRVLPAAYAPRPGELSPRYDLATAQNALTKIAAAMNQDGTRDLQWWRIPGWVSPTRRILVVGLGLGFGLVVGLVAGLTERKDTSSPSPVMSWRADRSYALVVGLAVAVVVGLAVGLAAGLAAGIGAGLAEGLMAGLGVGIGVGLVAGPALGLAAGLVVVLANSQVWPSSVALAQLAMRWHTPLRLMKFLDDARERNVLRTIGSVYQFRHARLQDRLAGASHGSGNDSNTASRLTHADNLPGHEL
jgi:hypothetical protein